ncbi:MAG: hypothetical protein NVS4B8_07620 [Herpetosiphon sp.]
MPKYYTATAQWGLVSGIRQDASDLIILHQPPSRFSPQARKGQLLIVAEAAGDVARGREACERAASVLHDTYYADGVSSITSALRKAMRSANEALYGYNYSAPNHKRATVGLSAAVLFGSDVFLAQVPPTQAFIAHAGKLRALPNPLSWVGGAQSGLLVGSLGGLGTSLGSEPEFFRSALQPGDTVVVCSSNVARLLSKHQAEQLFCYSDAKTVAEGLYELCRQASLPEAHAAVLEIMPALSVEAQQAPLSAASVSERSKLAAGKVGEWLGDIASEAQLAVAKRAQAEQDDAPEVLQTATLAAVAEPSEQAPLPTGNGRDLLSTVPIGDNEPLPLSAFIGEGDYGGVVRPSAAKQYRHIDLSDNHGMPVDFAALPKRTPLPPPTVAQQFGLGLRQIRASVLGAATRQPRRSPRLQPVEKQSRPRIRGLSYRKTRTPFPWLQVGLLLTAFAILVAVGLQVNRRRDLSRVNEAVNGVEQEIKAAQNSTDQKAAQQHLAVAERRLKEFTPLISSGLITTTKRTNWAAYQQLLHHYDRSMAEINHIGFFENWKPIASLPNQGAQITRIVMGSDQTTRLISTTLYLLDGSTDTLYSQEGSTARPVLRPGDTVANVQVGKIRDLLWRNENPVALERNIDPNNPYLIVYLHGAGKDSWFANKLPGSEWLPVGKEIPATTYGGNLYVWNADAKRHYGAPDQLFKYTTGRYADVPEEWITNRRPGTMDEVASIVIDGRVYMLHPNGSINVFEGGNYKRDLPSPDISPPVSAIRRFVVTPDVVDETTGKTKVSGHIFLLDTQNERIIELDKNDGHVVQQMMARQRGPLNRLTDLLVDERTASLYLANGNQVLYLPLPAEPGKETAPSATTATVTR